MYLPSMARNFRQLRQELAGREGVARWPNYPYAIKVIKAIIREVKRLRGNASSGRMGCWHGAWPDTQQQAQHT